MSDIAEHSSVVPYVIPGQSRQHGFTLLEVLVALLVFGLLTAGLAKGFQVGLLAWDAQNARLASQNDLDSVDRSLRELLSRTNPGGFGDEVAPFQGSSQSLTFATTLPRAASGLSWNEADVTLNVNGDHELELLWSPRYRNPIGPAPSWKRVVLRNEVDHLELAYWQDAKTGWQPTWTPRTLPKLVRVRMVPMAKVRAWPDLVIAPMRNRWHQ